LLRKLPFLFLFLTFHAVSDIHVGADEWVEFTHSDGSGIYFELLRKIYREEVLKFHVSPFARVKSKFTNKELDIIVGIYPEDIVDKLLPSWPLGLESPIVAFYDSRKVALHHISDIEKVTASWVRGYDFDKFLPLTHSSYDVNSPMIGFRLLLNGHIDAFVDYSYNQPKDLPEYIKTFQLMPSRNLYVAFQSNLMGKKLAEIFDAEMAKLMQSGELERMFGHYYAATGFDKHVDEKTTIKIFTDERDLLGKKESRIDKPHSSLYTIATMLDEQLSKFSFSYHELSDVEQVLKGKKHRITCALNAVKSQARENSYILSDPISLYEGLRLYSTKRLQASDPVHLLKTLNQNSTLRLGVHSGRSYGNLLDKKIKSLKTTQVFKASSDEVASIKQLHNNRFDLLIESPIIFEGYWPQIDKNKKIYNYKLASSKPYITGHLVCAKSKGTLTFINEVNSALKSLYQTGLFYKAQKSLSKSSDHQKFVEAYIQNFR